MSWLQKIAKWTRPEFELARDYWDKNLEHNPLRGRAETSVGAIIAYLIEAAGDILREYSKDYRDPVYINEKIQRLKKQLNNNANFKGTLSENETIWISEIQSTLEGLPTPSPEIEYIKILISKMILMELHGAKFMQQKLYSRLRDQGLTFEPIDNPKDRERDFDLEEWIALSPK